MAIRPGRMIPDAGGPEDRPVSNRRSSGIAGTEFLVGEGGQETLVYSGTDRAVMPGTPANRKSSGIAGTEILIEDTGKESLVYRGTQTIVEPGKPAPSRDTWGGNGSTGNPLTLNGSPYTGDYNGATYVNGVLKVDNAPSQSVSYAGNGNAQSPLTANGVPYTGILYGANYINGVIQQAPVIDRTKELEDKQRRTAQQEFKATLSEYGLADLADTVDAMIREDKTIAQIKMDLPSTTKYKERFPAMEALRKAGQAINEATYISNERGYLQTLRAFGLDTGVLGSRQMLGSYIENTVAPREFEERVSMAATRLDENPDVMATFKTFYPEVDKSAVLTYILNPKVGVDVIRKQVRTAEIGSAAMKAGFKAPQGLSEFESLISPVGEASYAQISTEFQRARQLANAQKQLAGIEGQAYNEMEAIQAVVGDNIPAMLESQRRTARGIARFQERGGVTAASLRDTTI